MYDDEHRLIILARKAKEGDEKAFSEIVKILENDIKKIASKFYISGSDDQDVFQECKIGMWKAVKDFNENGGMSFKNFSLGLCVKRHLLTAISHANTLKFKLQNEAVSLSAPTSTQSDDVTLTYADVIIDHNSDLEQNYIAQEEFHDNLELIKEKLTSLELSIFGQYAFNSSYKDIAKALDVKPKTVDNALMRIRKKSSEIYKSYQETLTFSISSSGICTSFFSSQKLTFEVGITSSEIRM
jgi:RNA polymerase sporulation-specific sigma factor